jgi:hypothetical protein
MVYRDERKEGEIRGIKNRKRKREGCNLPWDHSSLE